MLISTKCFRYTTKRLPENCTLLSVTRLLDMFWLMFTRLSWIKAEESMIAITAEMADHVHAKVLPWAAFESRAWAWSWVANRGTLEVWGGEISRKRAPQTVWSKIAAHLLKCTNIDSSDRLVLQFYIYSLWLIIITRFELLNNQNNTAFIVIIITFKIIDNCTSYLLHSNNFN